MIDDTSNLSTTAALRVTKSLRKNHQPGIFWRIVFFIDLFFGGCGIRVDVPDFPETNAERKSETETVGDSGPFGIFQGALWVRS